MKTFNLEGLVTISVSTKVEAETLEEAIEIAEGRPIEQYQWGDKEQHKESWISSEYDGEVFDVTNQP